MGGVKPSGRWPVARNSLTTDYWPLTTDSYAVCLHLRSELPRGCDISR